MGDRCCDSGQAKIANIATRDEYDSVTVQEKLDGSNVGITLLDGVFYLLTRSGYIASESSLEQHWRYSNWVYSQLIQYDDPLKQTYEV